MDVPALLLSTKQDIVRAIVSYTERKHQPMMDLGCLPGEYVKLSGKGSILVVWQPHIVCSLLNDPSAAAILPPFRATHISALTRSQITLQSANQPSKLPTPKLAYFDVEDRTRLPTRWVRQAQAPASGYTRVRCVTRKKRGHAPCDLTIHALIEIAELVELGESQWFVKLVAPTLSALTPPPPAIPLTKAAASAAGSIAGSTSGGWTSVGSKGVKPKVPAYLRTS